jgi:hypothetical protein
VLDFDVDWTPKAGRHTAPVGIVELILDRGSGPAPRQFCGQIGAAVLFTRQCGFDLHDGLEIRASTNRV